MHENEPQINFKVGFHEDAFSSQPDICEAKLPQSLLGSIDESDFNTGEDLSDAATKASRDSLSSIGEQVIPSDGDPEGLVDARHQADMTYRLRRLGRVVRPRNMF